MKEHENSDLDYLAARLHGRRSVMAEARRLDALCRLRTLGELTHLYYPASGQLSIGMFQKRLIEDLAKEFLWLATQLSKEAKRLLEWLVVRFYVENLKTLVRGLVAHGSTAKTKDFLVSLPRLPNLEDLTRVYSTTSLAELVCLLPKGIFRRDLSLKIDKSPPLPFLLETAMDSAYFRELLVRFRRLAKADQEAIWPLLAQEIDLFHLMLAVRGRFIYSLQPNDLIPLHVKGTRITESRFLNMLTAPDLTSAVTRAPAVLGELQFGAEKAPQRINPALYEHSGWKRFLQMANSAIRRDTIGLGTIIGYTAIRRIEVANLITISEGIRAGLGSDLIRARLVDSGGVHV